MRQRVRAKDLSRQPQAAKTYPDIPRVSLPKHGTCKACGSLYHDTKSCCMRIQVSWIAGKQRIIDSAKVVKK